MTDTLLSQDWYTLDNAAKIYPAATSIRSPAVFRLAVTLKAPIGLSALEQALKTVLRRCPYFQVYLRRGLFWYYLQKHEHTPRVELLAASPVSVVPMRGRTAHLFRVYARQSTIAIDFSHILTDGTGGLRFLGTLVAEYLRIRGVDITRWDPFLDPREEPAPQEYEDAFRRRFRGGTPEPSRLSPAYHLHEKPPRQRAYRSITGRMPVAGVLALAKECGVTLTEYLVALYISSLAQIHSAENGPRTRPGHSVIRLEVPVNMRRFHPSETMRNFSLYVSPEVDLRLGSYTFEELVARVHHSMRMQVDRRELGRQIARNVGAELNPIVRSVPLFLKDLYLSRAYSRMSEEVYSGVLSNLGKISVPDQVEPYIESFRFVLDPSDVVKKNCSVHSYLDSLCITFGSVIDNTELERLFFSSLAHTGIAVHVSEA